MQNTIVLCVLSQFNSGTSVLKAGTQVAPGFKPLTTDIVYMKDTAVKMRDGVTIYTDVFLSVTDERVPVLWITTIKACLRMNYKNDYRGKITK